MRTRLSTFLGEALIAGALMILGAAQAQTPAPTAGAATPIQHLVVIFQENISFDHYFGTYPFADESGRRTCVLRLSQHAERQRLQSGDS